MIQIQITKAEAQCLVNVINNISVPLREPDAAETAAILIGIKNKVTEVFNEQEKPLVSATKEG